MDNLLDSEETTSDDDFLEMIDMQEIEDSVNDIQIRDEIEVELPVSLTTVHVMKTNEILPVAMLFSFCPITHMTIETFKTKNRKLVLPPSPFGSICSVRYGKYTRGVKRSETIKAFRNSVTFDISTGLSYISVKFSMSKTKDGSTIHIAGKAKSVEEIKELINIIVEETRNSVNWFLSNIDLCVNLLELMEKGEQRVEEDGLIKRYYYGTYLFAKETTHVEETFVSCDAVGECTDTICMGNGKMVKTVKVEREETQDPIYAYVSHFASEFTSIGGLMSTLIKLRDSKLIFPPTLYINDIKMEVDKYKFRIADKLNLIKLSRLIRHVISKNGYNGVILIYNNMIHKNIVFKVATGRHGNDKGYCTICIFKTGTTSLSSRYTKGEAVRAYKIFKQIYFDTIQESDTFV